MLEELSAAEIIEDVVIPILGTIAKHYASDEQTADQLFHSFTSGIVKHVQIKTIRRGEQDLRRYEEPRQRELFLELAKIDIDPKIKKEPCDELFKSWKDSGLTFNEWLNPVRL